MWVLPSVRTYVDLFLLKMNKSSKRIIFLFFGERPNWLRPNPKSNYIRQMMRMTWHVRVDASYNFQFQFQILGFVFVVSCTKYFWFHYLFCSFLVFEILCFFFISKWQLLIFLILYYLVAHSNSVLTYVKLSQIWLVYMCYACVFEKFVTEIAFS